MTFGVLAQATSPDVTGWLTGSAVTVLAFIVVAFMRGWIVPGNLHNLRLKEAEELRAELRAATAVYQEQVIPALVRATDILARYAEQQRTA